MFTTTDWIQSTPVNILILSWWRS